VEGRLIHRRCLARAAMLEATEAQDRARRLAARAQGLVDRAQQAVREGRRLTTCAACGRPLSSGGGLLFDGDDLVHAACWSGVRP